MHKITKRLIYPGLMVYSKVGTSSCRFVCQYAHSIDNEYCDF